MARVGFFLLKYNEITVFKVHVRLIYCWLLRNSPKAYSIDCFCSRVNGHISLEMDDINTLWSTYLTKYAHQVAIPLLYITARDKHRYYLKTLSIHSLMHLKAPPPGKGQ